MKRLGLVLSLLLIIGIPASRLPAEGAEAGLPQTNDRERLQQDRERTRDAYDQTSG